MCETKIETRAIEVEVDYIVSPGAGGESVAKGFEEEGGDLVLHLRSSLRGVVVVEGEPAAMVADDLEEPLGGTERFRARRAFDET